MSREIDVRDHSANRITPSLETELNSLAATVSDSLPGMHRVRVRGYNAATGNPAIVASEAAPAEKINYVQRALDHIQGIRRVLGLTATQPAEFSTDPNYQTTSSGAVAVHLQQLYKGIPVFQATETVRFAPDGAIKETVGSSFTIGRELQVNPQLTVQEAVKMAAEHIAVPGDDELGIKDQFGQPLDPVSVDLSGFEPATITAYPEKSDRPTVLEAGPFGDKIKASLIWFSLGDELRLAWEVLAAMPDYREQYRTLVDAKTGQILYCHQLMKSIKGRGNVYRKDGGTSREMTDFPRSLTDYGLPIPENELPAEFPDDWVTNDKTVGNSAHAHLGYFGPPSAGASEGDIMSFDPADPDGDDQKVLNIFYYNCFMHDYFYLLNFREPDGNFQRDNLGRGGHPFDRVDSRAHSGAVQGTANMYTPIDGKNPIMNMGPVTSTNRHTAFDSSVVFHEFTHGVTNRLVGGPANTSALEADQSDGMGEGWSDYIPCTINDSIVVGDWVVDDPRGIREFPYDSDFPDNFEHLGTGRYDEEHNIGEIWCATLLEMNRNIGKILGVQLVIDALKLTPANPSFLDARDAILSALDDMLTSAELSDDEHRDASQGIWKAFARFGMGQNASSNGATLSGIVADFTVPGDVEPQHYEIIAEDSPNLAIPDNDPTGVTSVLTIQRSGKIDRIFVSVDIQHTYIGDLILRLSTPTGNSVILHDRLGASKDNLVTSYTSEEVSVLNNLLGKQTQGEWTLHVSDLAWADEGILRHWSLGMDLESDIQVFKEEITPGMTIPDNDPSGVGSSINIAQAGTAQRIKLNVDITHTYIGDLRVELIAPSGQKVLVHNQIGGYQDNLIREYDSQFNSPLAVLLEESIEGQWELHVADLMGYDVGKFNAWSLEISY